MRRIALLTCTAVAAVVTAVATPQLAGPHPHTTLTATGTTTGTTTAPTTGTTATTDSAGWQ
ncbi:hypothetical protein [Streptomyces wedmorensis]